MKLLIIRHGDPDYEHDTLTEKGWREARYLADRLVDMDIQYFYVSPLGRARDTAAPTLERLGKQGVECPWLREFTVAIRRPDRPERDSICWDWLPQDWTGDGRLYSVDHWQENEVMAAGGVKREYDRVADSLDRLLASHGYVREGRHYRVERANHDTLAFFCHFGSGCVLLSHLLGAPPMVLWQGLCAAPTSVTTVVTEERREGIASFRASAYGDVSHLYVKGEPPAFSARFCECYADEDRHD